MTGLVLRRAAHEPSAPELYQPDMWILMGGAAIATLAGDSIDTAGLGEIRPVTVVTRIVASAWIPLLVAASVRLRDGGRNLSAISARSHTLSVDQRAEIA
jgi:hypothetical protein